MYFLCKIAFTVALLVHALSEDDCVGADAQRRTEISCDRNETNVCMQLIRFIVTNVDMQVRTAVNAKRST